MIVALYFLQSGKKFVAENLFLMAKVAPEIVVKIINVMDEHMTFMLLHFKYIFGCTVNALLIRLLSCSHKNHSSLWFPVS